MDIFNGKIPLCQSIFFSEPQGQFLSYTAAHLRKSILHQIAEHFLGNTFRCRVNRNDTSSCEVFADTFYFRRKDLRSAVFFLQFSAEKIPFANFQTVFHVGLIIPENAYRTCFIVNLHTSINQSAMTAILPFFLHLRQKSRGFVHGQVCNFQNLTSVLIFSGIMGQQVFNSANAQLLQFTFSLLPNAFQRRYRAVPIHDFPSFLS